MIASIRRFLAALWVADTDADTDFRQSLVEVQEQTRYTDA